MDKNNNIVRNVIIDDTSSNAASIDINLLRVLPKARQKVDDNDSDSNELDDAWTNNDFNDSVAFKVGGGK